MRKKVEKSVHDSLYDVVILKDVHNDEFLGTLHCRVIPRIGETIQVSSKKYVIKNVIYDIKWEEIDSVSIYIDAI